ncbi:MAG: DNA mismatch repair endonuclease MutL [Elusimicrobia bacterium]|nr:DNA mismatch repair endonuclease MutL [Elusimicrobiota bacterium]
MKNKVRKLPDDIVRGIAAGEVVERPASVLKELLENAVDAGARRLEIEWRDAGRRRLRVTDDGGGMTPDDARLALERHATSKIAALADLETLSTYGFRGEALPSIAAVSRFGLSTRSADGEGWSIALEAGRPLREGPAGVPPGTTITVDDLFFAVPARLKFLKSDATERALLLRTVEDVALAEPGLELRILSEDRPPLVLPAVPVSDREALRDRLARLWGADRARTLKPVESRGANMSVSGWVSDVLSAQPTGRYQRFFINRRPVVSRRLSHALYDAYRGRLPIGKHPAAVLVLHIDPEFVDVNVHPTKKDVRLSHEDQVHGFVSRAVQEALSRDVHTAPAFAPAAGRAESAEVRPAPFAFPRPPSLTETRAAFEFQQPLTPAPPNAEAGDGGFSREWFQAAAFAPLAQIYGTYVLAQAGGEFFIFDQHAAAERALYERLTADAETGARQGLLLPWVWEPASEAAALLTEQRPAFESLGFRLEAFGAASFRVTAVPAALGDSPRVREVLEGLADDLTSGKIPRGLEALRVRAACRGSLMAGAVLSAPEMAGVIGRLQGCQSPWTCPHGRPTFLRLTNEDLAKRFRRM